uniref:Uncharacterized protein n=1 Tax=Wuchereria bancrofti TaxID=6293 RepID=A0AAF5Q6C6_WUCBA
MSYIVASPVGRVKIQIFNFIEYKNEKIADTVLHLQGQTVTKYGQKFRAPAVIDNEKIEREIEALRAKNDMPKRKTDDDKLRQLHAKIHSPKNDHLPNQKKQYVGDKSGLNDSGGGRELIERIKGQVEKISAEFEPIKFLILNSKEKLMKSWKKIYLICHI